MIFILNKIALGFSNMIINTHIIKILNTSKKTQSGNTNGKYSTIDLAILFVKYSSRYHSLILNFRSYTIIYRYSLKQHYKILYYEVL